MSEARRRAIIGSVVGLLVAAGIGALFAVWIQSTGDWRAGIPWERSFMQRIDRDVPMPVDWVMLSLPWLGTNLTVLPILVAVALWLWRAKSRGDLATELLAVSLGSLILNAVMKAGFGRPRPELWEHRGQFAWASYPSGHAIVCASVLFTAALMLHRERGWRWPFYLAGTLLVVILYSRLYLGVHWPTDVIGGLLMGFVWLAGTQWAFLPFHNRRPTLAGREPISAAHDRVPVAEA